MPEIVFFSFCFTEIAACLQLLGWAWLRWGGRWGRLCQEGSRNRGGGVTLLWLWGPQPPLIFRAPLPSPDPTGTAGRNIFGASSQKLPSVSLLFARGVGELGRVSVPPVSGAPEDQPAVCLVMTHFKLFYVRNKRS